MSAGSNTTKYRANARNVWEDNSWAYGLCTLPATYLPSNGVDSAFTITNLGETWSGADRRNYKELIKSGQNVTNPYTKSWTSVDCSLGAGGHYREDRASICGAMRPYRIRKESWTREVVPTVPTSVPGFSAEAQRAAAQAFIRKARARLSEAQALVTAGETRESWRMVLNARKGVFDKLRSFQKAAVKNTARIKNVTEKKKAIAGTWIEYSFGWAPLVGDSVNLANAFGQTMVGNLRPRRVSHQTEFTSVIEEGNGYNWGYGTSSTDARSRLMTVQRCRYFGCLRFDTGHPGDFKSAFGLTMDNWVPSIWELIPWSFAIDYFTGIGDFLSQLTFPTSHFAYYGRSRKTEVIREYYDWKNTAVNVNTSTATRRYWATPGKSRAKRGVFERDIPAAIVNTPRLRMPGYSGAYLNLAALGVLRTNNRI